MDLSSLNKEQQEAVLYNDGPLLIIAGAGSGKTRVITYKVAYLIDKGVDPSNILAITFTNKAADEMKERIENLVPDSSKKIFVSTFHKFCGRVLRSFIESIGYNRSFTIYDTEDVTRLIGKILKDFNYDDKKVKSKSIANKISYCKNHGIEIDELEKSIKSENDKILVRVYKEYEDRMFKANAIDFDDMLLLTVKVLKANEEARKILARRFKYILIDEYQDTNLVQFEIVKLLTKDKNNFLTVVGDDDQSIYKFRGADISNILEFEENFENAKVVKLTQNYRSTNNILDVANSVIKHNIGRKGKELWSESGEGNKVIFTEYEDDYKEAYTIINNIKKDGHYKDTAILYRANAQSRKFEEMCVSLSIPYVIIGGVNFYARKEIKDIVAYLHLIVNQNDISALTRVINVPKRGIGDTTIEAVDNFAKEKNITMYDALLDIDSVDIKPKAKEKIKDFVALINELKSEKEIDTLIEKILDKGYKDYLIDEYGIEDGEDRVNNIKELKNKASTFQKVYPTLIQDENMRAFAEENSAHSILEDFLYEISLVSDVDNLDRSEDKLTLMSLHASKGLEYDTIYLTGLNEGVFPSYQCLNSENVNEEIEEERRLCYVGITRAKNHLYLSSAKRRMQNGAYNNFMVSRFVDEIDTDAIEKKQLTTNTIFENDFSGGEYWNYNRKRNNFTSKKVSFNRFEEKSTSKVDLKKSIDSYKTGSNIVKATSLDYKVGDTVSHVKFGRGKVLKIEDIGRDYEVTIDFEDAGEKTLFAAFAKLIKES